MRNIIRPILDYIYPPCCHQCGELGKGGDYLCESCFDSAKRIETPFCDICSEPFEGNISSNLKCPNCHDLTFTFSKARSALFNTDTNRQLVLDFKYGKQIYLGKVLASFCSELVENDPVFTQLKDPVLVPVPLHRRRKFQRTFNQAEVMVKAISSYMGLPYANLLKRRIYTTTQTRLSREKRLTNLKNAFSPTAKKTNFRSIIIVDDVFTTGSTSEACATTLKKEYPNIENIVVLTALRG